MSMDDEDEFRLRGMKGIHSDWRAATRAARCVPSLGFAFSSDRRHCCGEWNSARFGVVVVRAATGGVCVWGGREVGDGR